MLRTEHGWKDITYDEAIHLVANKLREVKAEHGAQVSKRLALTSPLWDCRESELAALMTMRLAGGVNVMPAGEVCISTTSNVLNMLLGANTSTTTVNEILNAKLLIIWGANLAETYPVYARWLQKAQEKGIKIIYIDPRKTSTSQFATTQIRMNPGTDGVLAMGAIRHILEIKAYDANYIAQSTTGFEALQQGVEPWTREKVAEITGLTQSEIMAFYTDVQQSDRTIVWLGGSLCRYTNGVQTIRSIIAMQGLRKTIIGAGCGLLTMEGGKPEGEKDFIDAICGPAKATGVNFRRLLNAMKKKNIDLLFLNSSYRRYPDCDAVKKAMQQCGMVVYRGFFHTEEMDVATLFVPATFSLESAGSHYGAEKHVVWRDKALQAPGSCVPDWQFYRDVGRLLAPDTYPAFEDPAELTELFNKTVESWHGFSVDALRASPDGLIWPKPNVDTPDRIGSIFTDGVLHNEDGKFHFALPTLGKYSWTWPRSNPKARKADPNYNLVLIQGKVATQWQQTMTNFAPSLAGMAQGRSVEVHPETAKGLGIKHGDVVMLETSIGGIEAWVDVTPRIMPNIVFTASHFEPNSPFSSTRSKALNAILPNNWDRVSAQFNGTGCRLIKLDRASIKTVSEGS